MRTSSRIAFIAALALAFPTLVSLGYALTYGPNLSLATTSFGVLIAFLEGVSLGVFVWIGTYVGVRWAAPHQRTVRLARVLGVLYFILGVAISRPVKTHAVLMDMPPASNSTSPLDFISPLLTYVVGPLALVVVPLLLARGIATACDRFNRVAR